MGAAIRLHLDDVGNPIVARVAHRAGDRMIVAQPLPFLRLSGKLRDGDGRQGRIDGVRVEVEDGVPTLLLDVVYEREPFRAAREEDTLPGFVPEGVEIEVPKPRRDATIPFEFQREEPRFVVAISDAPPAQVIPSRWSRVWMRIMLWARSAELFVDRMLATRAARA